MEQRKQPLPPGGCFRVDAFGPMPDSDNLPPSTPLFGPEHLAIIAEQRRKHEEAAATVAHTGTLAELGKVLGMTPAEIEDMVREGLGLPPRERSHSMRT